MKLMDLLRELGEAGEELAEEKRQRERQAQALRFKKWR